MTPATDTTNRTPELSPEHTALLHKLADEAPAPPNAAVIRAGLLARVRRRRVRAIGVVAAAAVVVLALGLGAVIASRTQTVEPPAIAGHNNNDHDVDVNAGANENNSQNNATPAPDDGAVPPAPLPLPDENPPVQRATPIAADASLAAMQDGVSTWLRAVGADRARITKLPRGGLSISVAGSGLSPGELSADLAVLLQHYDIVSVRLDGHGLRCSLSQLH